MEILRSRVSSDSYSDLTAYAMIDIITVKNADLDNAEPRKPPSTTPTSFRQWCAEIFQPALIG
jgi:hypothetical protein